MRKLKLTNDLLNRRPAEGHRLVEPAPFPGKWPTKVAVRLQYGGAARMREGQLYNAAYVTYWDYIGKPHIGLIRQLQNILTRRLGQHLKPVQYIWATEFDRKNTVRTLAWSYPGNEHWQQMPTSREDSWLRHLYHPFEENILGTATSMPVFFTNFNGGMFSKRIKVAGEVLTVYSPVDRLKMENHIIPFKKWVESQRAAKKAWQEAKQAQTPQGRATLTASWSWADASAAQSNIFRRTR